MAEATSLRYASAFPLFVLSLRRSRQALRCCHRHGARCCGRHACWLTRRARCASANKRQSFNPCSRNATVSSATPRKHWSARLARTTHSANSSRRRIATNALAQHVLPKQPPQQALQHRADRQAMLLRSPEELQSALLPLPLPHSAYGGSAYGASGRDMCRWMYGSRSVRSTRPLERRSRRVDAVRTAIRHTPPTL